MNALFIFAERKKHPKKILLPWIQKKRRATHTPSLNCCCCCCVCAPLNWLCWKKVAEKDRMREWRGEIKKHFFLQVRGKKQMNLGKDHYHKREILSYKQCSSPPIPSFHFNLSQWLQQKISFAKKEGIRKVGEGGKQECTVRRHH